VRLLLDTHAFLWFILADPKLNAAALNLITDPANQKQISPTSYWEIAIKIRLGKYSLPSPYETFMRQQLLRNYFAILHIAVSHTAVLTTLPLHHRDPFDRLLVAQAMVEGIPLVSGDPALDAYPITRLW
jgi:PIN domain nuclease of toxin-antitoxin system